MLLGFAGTRSVKLTCLAEEEEVLHSPGSASDTLQAFHHHHPTVHIYGVIQHQIQLHFCFICGKPHTHLEEESGGQLK